MLEPTKVRVRNISDSDNTLILLKGAEVTATHCGSMMACTTGTGGAAKVGRAGRYGISQRWRVQRGSDAMATVC